MVMICYPAFLIGLGVDIKVFFGKIFKFYFLILLNIQELPFGDLDFTLTQDILGQFLARPYLFPSAFTIGQAVVNMPIIVFINYTHFIFSYRYRSLLATLASTTTANC